MRRGAEVTIPMLAGLASIVAACGSSSEVGRVSARFVSRYSGSTYTGSIDVPSMSCQFGDPDRYVYCRYENIDLVGIGIRFSDSYKTVPSG